MTVRPSTHANEEGAVFDAFLAAYPSFAAQVKDVDQPDDAFPDVVVATTTGTVIDFELGEWLDGAQMGSAKRYEQFRESIVDTVGPQDPNLSSHFRAVMLTPREDIAKFDASDRTAFRTELWTLVAATDHLWPAEPHWHSPQGRLYRDFAEHPTLGRYLRSVHFDPLVVRGALRPWPPGQPWVFVAPRGGWYSPDAAVAALHGILNQKIAHYGRFTRPTRLIVYYSRAFMYNTPYFGVETCGFADAAALAAQAVCEQTAFEKIYLLDALEPGLEVFEIFPGCARCS